MYLLCISLVNFLLIGTQIQLVVSAKTCKICDADEPDICEENEEDVECTRQHIIHGMDVLKNFFKFGSIKTYNAQEFECFVIDVILPEDEDETLRIKNCIFSDVNVCDLVPSPFRANPSRGCFQCSQNGCNDSYNKTDQSNNSPNQAATVNTTLNLKAASSHASPPPGTARNSTHSPKVIMDLSPNYSIIFSLIVYSVIYCCFFAWLVISKLCLMEKGEVASASGTQRN